MKSQNNVYLNEINGNYSTPVIVKTRLYDWHNNYKAEFKKKRLEYIDADGPRLTSLVQFPPGSAFKKCTHDRGEELLVLTGDFSNNGKKYGPGTYVRNPPNKKFTSATKDGCALLFKTGQFQKLDNKRVVVHAAEHEDLWKSTLEPGVSRAELHQFLDETVSLYKIRPQCWVTFRLHTHSIEILVCDGTITVDGIKYTTGTWIRYPPNSRIKITSITLVCLYVKKGKMHIK